MRFESVTAHAFGPFKPGTTINFSPGMNVIYGPNEAGKTSWHAALYAGLCGLRRGKGQPSKEERRFSECHRPWGGDQWSVGVRVRLEDGRTIDLRHDLDTRLGQAMDPILGREYTDEIMHDNAPDGSKWLGLDRSAFLATACVRQADIIGIRDDARGLQEYLQRAAASGSADATVTRALESIAAFRKNAIGADQANAVGPLRQTQRAVEAANRDLSNAQGRHDAYLQAVIECKELEQRLSVVELDLRLLEAGLASQEAAEQERRLERAKRLNAKFPDGAPPDIDTLAGTAKGVTEALKAWQDRPSIPKLSGRSVEELEHLLSQRQPYPRLPSLLGALSIVVAAGLWFAGFPVPGAVLFLAGVLVVTWSLAGGRRTEAANRSQLQEELRQRRQAEALVEVAVKRCSKAESEIRSAASKCGLDAKQGPEVIAKELHLWLEQYNAELGRLQQAHRDWAELQTLLDGGTLDDLVKRVEASVEAARRKAKGLDPSAVVAVGLEEDTQTQVARLRKAVEDARSHRDRADERLRNMRKDGGLTVSEAEEALAAAGAEMARVLRLRATLDSTDQFLKNAEGKVLIDVAKILKGAVGSHLPGITSGRYVDVAVYPADLRVQVQEATSGAWRDAGLLSHGTAEQIYLLLRLAMAQWLVRAGEICPLILDDVTTQSDRARTLAILEALRELSLERQVILFTQEDEVLEWARANLDEEGKDRLIELSAVEAR